MNMSLSSFKQQKLSQFFGFSFVSLALIILLPVFLLALFTSSEDFIKYILGFNLTCITLSALIGFYLKGNIIVRNWIYLIYIAVLLYAIYTGYDAATCDDAKCNFIIFYWFFAIISANLILFSFLYHFKIPTRMYPIKVMWWCTYIIILQIIILFLFGGFLSYFLS